MPKTIAVMQPYFFPYLGYWQLLSNVDEFVLLDDVNFIKRGWINRNKISQSGQEIALTVPLHKQSQNKHINQHAISSDDRWRNKMFTTLANVYSKAPYYESVMPYCQTVLLAAEGNLASFLTKSLLCICEYLRITTTLSTASSKYTMPGLVGSDRILAICQQSRASRYVNLPGGKGLYRQSDFAAKGIELAFIKPSLPDYARGSDAVMPGLSIIDILMFNSPDEVRTMLTSFELEY